MTRTAHPKKNAPSVSGNSAEGNDRNTNDQKENQYMTSIAEATAPVEVARYYVIGTDVYDRETGRFAKFQNAGVAQIGADWLNTPEATPDDYEWTEPTEEDWEDYASQYLAAHPEISAAVPSWAEEVELGTIDDELEGTLFSFSTHIGDVELYGSGRLALDGAIRIHNDGIPSIYLPAELDGDKCPDITQWMLSLAQNLIAGATLLRSEPKLLRRSAATEELLREREQ